jgi:hypothetical protein
MSIENLITSIIEKYNEKEKKLDNVPYKYYTYYEFDANNATKFEELSNSNLIGIKSKLDKDDIIVIINIFKAICDKNYYIFNLDFITEIIEDEELKDETYLINSIQSYDNINDWIRVLKLLPDTFNMSEKKLLPCRENLLRNIKTNKLVNKNFKKIEQKYYLINEIFYDKEYYT